MLKRYKRPLWSQKTQNRKPRAKLAREDRLKAALKANMARRKAQAKARTARKVVRVRQLKIKGRADGSDYRNRQWPRNGQIPIAGAKNACLALMPATLLSEEPLTSDQCATSL